MAGEPADGDVVAAVAHVRQVGQPPDVDEHRRRREPQLHQRQQRVAAGQQLGLVAVLDERGDGGVGRVGPDVVEGGGDHADAPLLAWIACHTRSGVAGMTMSVMP